MFFAVDLFDLSNKVIIVTGATGVLAGSAARYLAARRARVVLVGRDTSKLIAAVTKLRELIPYAECIALEANVLDENALLRMRESVIEKWGVVDGLVNGAGGNIPKATLTPEMSFADLDFEAFQGVVDLNLHGTVLPSLIFAPVMARQGRGSIVNFSSVSAPQAVTRVAGYSAAKAGVESFTRWLGVELGRRTSGTVRVNAVLPGFFLSEQNRRLLTEEDGSLTERGRLVIEKTPFRRFGEAAELHGSIHYLLSEASKFVTGTVLPVDGGFLAFSGV